MNVAIIDPAVTTPTGLSRRAPRRAPVSLAQKRLWVIEQLEDRTSVLNIAVSWRLEGPVDPRTLGDAFQDVVDRHPALRTGFVEIGDEPVQMVHDDVRATLEVVDLTAREPGAAEADVARIAWAEAHCVFALACPPLIRATLLRLSGEAAILVVTVHHLVADGWSVGLIARDLGTFYAARRTGVVARLPDLATTCGEIATLERNRAQTAEAAETLAFWRATLRGMPYVGVLPDMPRPDVQTTNGQIRSILLARTLTDPLVALSRQVGCTLFMSALSILLILLRNATGETDIAVSTQLAGRDDVDHEDVVGMFIRTLVLRVDLAGASRASALMERVRDVVLDAFEHQDVSFEHLMEASQRQRDLSRKSICAVNFIFQRSFVDNVSYADIRLVDLPSYPTGGLYELNFFMVERPEGWRFACEYNSDLYFPETIDVMLHRFARLIATVIADPQVDPTRMRMPDAIVPPRRALAPLPSLRVDALFETQVAQRPHVVAVACAGHSLTYRALDIESDRLAVILRTRVAPGGHVGVLLGRSVRQAVALLAVLKAGLVYVAVDPGAHAGKPGRAVDAIVGAARLDLLLTESRCDAAAAAIAAPRLLLDMAPDRGAAGEPGMAGEPGIGQEATAAVDARPVACVVAGVAVTHAALCDLLGALRAELGVGPEDTLLAATPFVDGVALLDLLLPLVSGARLVIAEADESATTAAVAAAIARHAPTVMQGMTADWQDLVDAGWSGAPALRVLCGGAPIRSRLASALLARVGAVVVAHAPAAAGLWAMATRLTGTEGRVPAGRPLGSVICAVLDAEGEPVAPLVPGQLFVGGGGIGEAMVATRPCVTADGVALVATGETARVRAVGVIELVAQAGEQLKLGALWADPELVEAVLLRHDAVREAAAIVVPARDGLADDEAAIEAFVAAPDATPDATPDLQRALADLADTALPRFLSPRHVTVLSKLPRRPDGATDRLALRALRSPDANVPTAPAAQTGPNVTAAPTAQTALAAPTALAAVAAAASTETRLTAIWCEVLERPVVGRDDDFFEIGGHSLLAARLLARIATNFGRRVPLTALFRAPTIAKLARFLDGVAAPAPAAASSAAAAAPEPHRAPLFLLNTTDLTSIYYRLTRALQATRPVEVLPLLDDAADAAHVPPTCEAMAAAHAATIQATQPSGSIVVIGYCIGGAVAFETARQLAAAGRTVELVVMIDTWLPGYLRRMPRLRRALADRSHRMQLLTADLGKLLTRRISIATFLDKRMSVRRLRHSWRKQHDAITTFREAEDLRTGLSARTLAIRARIAEALMLYEPQPLAAPILVCRSREEPGGWWLDRAFGWEPFAAGALDVAIITGDHATMFEQPGADEMARAIVARLSTPSATAGTATAP